MKTFLFAFLLFCVSCSNVPPDNPILPFGQTDEISKWERDQKIKLYLMLATGGLDMPTVTSGFCPPKVEAQGQCFNPGNHAPF
jgi:hypothetical protein